MTRTSLIASDQRVITYELVGNTEACTHIRYLYRTINRNGVRQCTAPRQFEELVDDITGSVGALRRIGSQVEFSMDVRTVIASLIYDIAAKMAASPFAQRHNGLASNMAQWKSYAVTLSEETPDAVCERATAILGVTALKPGEQQGIAKG